MSLLEVTGLWVSFGSADSALVAVEDMDFSIDAGEIVGILGESGSGKTVSMLALLGLIDPPGVVTAKSLRFNGRELIGITERQRRALLGKEMAMVFQDASASLNPSLTIGYQLMEAIRVHQGGTGARLRARAVELLRSVEIPDPAARLRAFPHQLSGGMNQRVMIAMAIACGPKLLIADEPTTALDVTIQAQILELLSSLQRESGMAMILISHDMAVLAQVAHRAFVMYAGEIVETGLLPQLFEAPRHPYTAGLLASLPERTPEGARFNALSGTAPGLHERPVGCLFRGRCPFAFEPCARSRPRLEGTTNQIRCYAPLPAPGR
jgi:dipeptide transport system ATP-binding protein